jgi:hypothetical protein
LTVRIRRWSPTSSQWMLVFSLENETAMLHF